MSRRCLYHIMRQGKWNLSKWLKKINRIRFILRLRPLKYVFIRNWYSTYRWKNPYEMEDEKVRLLDIGMLTIGYAYKEEKQ